MKKVQGSLPDATQRRFIGMGQGPDPNAPNTDDVAKQVLGCGFSNVPVIEYVTWTTQVPLTDTEVSGTFGDEIDVLQNAKSVPGIDSVDSSFVQNGTLQVDMLTVGFGLHAFGEPLQLSIPGNAMLPLPAAGTAPIVSPDVFTQNDLIHGAMGPTSGILPADLEWGGADWNAIWHLVNAYQFQWIMQQRYLLIDELAADVSYFGPYAEAIASGTSDVIGQQYVRQTNNRYRSKAGGGIFVPTNARRVGSVTSSAPGAVNAAVMHPTRDFDLIPATWGGLRNQGAAGCCMPFRKLPKPVLLEKGIPIGMLLRVQDTYHQAQMQRYLSISEEQGGNLAQVALDANVGGLTNVGGADTFLELTLDQGVNTFANQQVQTDRVIFKGGCLKLAILIKGFEVWGPWKDYIVQNWKAYVQTPSVSGSMAGGPLGGR
jgi:hypothetical protein